MFSSVSFEMKSGVALMKSFALLVHEDGGDAA